MFEVENARGRPALLAPVSGVLDGSLFVLLLLLEVYCYWCCWLGCLLQSWIDGRGECSKCLLFSC